jgi:hypothetical protein
MAQIPMNMDTWEVPKKGSATASSETRVTISLIDDILKNPNLLGKPVNFRKMLIQADNELEGELFIAGEGKEFHCLSPNYTDVVLFDTPKPFREDLVVILTETLGNTPKYMMHLFGMRSIR